jgi:hypothetical protein
MGSESSGTKPQYGRRFESRAYIDSLLRTQGHRHRVLVNNSNGIGIDLRTLSTPQATAWKSLARSVFISVLLFFVFAGLSVGAVVVLLSIALSYKMRHSFSPSIAEASPPMPKSTAPQRELSPTPEPTLSPTPTAQDAKWPDGKIHSSGTFC